MEVMQEQFKDTKIGRIPKDWDVQNLGNLAQIGTGKKDLQNKVIDGKYPFFVRSKNIERINSYSFDGEAILIPGEGNIGSIFHYINGKFDFHQRVYKISGFIDFINGKYIYFYFEQFFKYVAIKNSVKATVDSLRLPTFKNMLIGFPPLPEQQKIAEILSTVDEQIGTTQAIIDKSKELKKGLIQKLFSEGIGHTEFKDTKIGRIPKGWEVVNLIDITKNGISNGVFNDPKKVGKGYKLINVVNMYKGSSIEINDLTLLDLEKNEFERNKVNYGDILFTRSSLVESGIAYSNINLSEDNDITYDGHLMKICPDNKIVNSMFLSYYFRGNIARKQFIARGKTTTMTTIGQKDIASVKIAIPSLDEQQRIAEILSEADAKIEKEELEKAQLEQLKKGLMQQLLTGKKRVKV